ncbi:MAG: hypothetical protein KKH98_11825 [Spirochaetes bacterium]|nr:hypothetical protein [Spirochaetota bacterium]
MSRFGNLFIPVLKGHDLVMPELGYKFNHKKYQFSIHTDGLFHDQFRSGYSGREGKMISFDNGHYLDIKDDWEPLYRFLNEMRRMNKVRYVDILIFITGEHYNLDTVKVIDMELMNTYPSLSDGQIYSFAVQTDKRLVAYKGKEVCIRLLNKKDVNGILIDYFDTEKRCLLKHGDTETVFYNSQISEVNLVK